jgi:hypothetical protein
MEAMPVRDVPGGDGSPGGESLTVIVTLADAEPFFFFEQVKVNVLVALMPDIPADPETDFVPDHPFEATHEVAFVVLQFRVAVPPGETLAGVADRTTVGVLLLLALCRPASSTCLAESIAGAAVAGAAPIAVTEARRQLTIQPTRDPGRRPWFITGISPSRVWNQTPCVGRVVGVAAL